MTSTHRFAAATRVLRAVLPPVTQGRVVLLGMASVLLLSGCMLSPLFQAPALVLTGISVLMGLAACGGGAGGGGGGTTATTTPTFPAVVSLNLLQGEPKYGVVLAGDGSYQENAGTALAIGASMNSNEIGSLVIGAPNAPHQVNVSKLLYTYSNVGKAYVVFGSTGFSTLGSASGIFSLGDLDGENGFTVLNPVNTSNHYLGTAVAIAPNIDANDVPMVLIGEPGFGEGLGMVRGVFAGLGAATINANELGDGGISFYNDYQDQRGVTYLGDFYSFGMYNNLGQTLATADLNGDGFTDLVMGAPYLTQANVCTNYYYNYDTNQAYCYSTGPRSFFPGANIFLGDGELGTDIDLPRNTPTFTVYSSSDYYVQPVAFASGHLHSKTQTVDDLVIGASYTTMYDSDSDYGYGTVYVVFGSSTSFEGGFPSTQCSFAGEGTPRGFLIYDSDYNAYATGGQVAVGDVNGDGIDDVILSDIFHDSENAYGYGTSASFGRVWVVFGKEEETPSNQWVNLSGLSSSEGFSIRLPNNAVVDSIAVGEINGDSKKDILIGSTSTEVRVPFTYYNSSLGHDVSSAHQYHNGAVFVVFGSSTPTSLSTSELTGPNGFTVIGGDEAKIGAALATGNLNGDAHDDVAIGAPTDHSYNYYTYGYASSGGQVYVVFGVDATKATLPAYSLVTAGVGAYLGGTTASVIKGGVKAEGAHAARPTQAAKLGTPAHAPSRKAKLTSR